MKDYIEIVQGDCFEVGPALCAEAALIKYLRFERGLVACPEVSVYGCIADILALDTRKKRICEFEFKRSSSDLKRNEIKKTKYGERTKYKSIGKGGGWVRTETPKPHTFHFVVPKELWEKEKEYLESLKDVGVLGYWKDKRGYTFWCAKAVRARKHCLQKYAVAERAMLTRLSSAYAGLYSVFASEVERAVQAEKDKLALFE